MNSDHLKAVILIYSVWLFLYSNYLPSQAYNIHTLAAY